MVVPSHLVVNPPPIEDSVLGWFVVAEGNTRLGQLLASIHAIRCACALLQAELSALRKQSCTVTPREVHPDPLPRKFAPYDPAWDVLREKALAEHFTGHTNWCPTCKQYVAWSHDGPGGIACDKYLQLQAQREAVRITKWRASAASKPVFTRNTHNAWKDGPINRNFVEERWVARIDQRTLAIEVRLKEGQSITAIADELGVSRTRVQQTARHILAKGGLSCVEAEQPVNRIPRKLKRHYVRHGASDISFVRKQDLELATEF